MIISETNKLPSETLAEILDFIQSFKTKKLNAAIKKSCVKDRKEELNQLNKISLLHLDDEFPNYKVHYPHGALFYTRYNGFGSTI